MVVGLKCTHIDWDKGEITLSRDNIRAVVNHYTELYNKEKKKRDYK